jgi:hypothetical protein
MQTKIMKGKGYQIKNDQGLERAKVIKVNGIIKTRIKEGRVNSPEIAI